MNVQVYGSGRMCRFVLGRGLVRLVDFLVQVEDSLLGYVRVKVDSVLDDANERRLVRG